MTEFCFSYHLYSLVNIIQCVNTLQNIKESDHQKILEVCATTTSLHSSRFLNHRVIEMFCDFRQFSGLNIAQLAVGMHLNFPGLIVIAIVAVGFYHQLT